jgi:hypothetical protein
MLDSYGRVTLDQRVDLDVTTFAGTAPSPGSADQTGASASFWSPFGISADATGNTCVADYQNHTIQEISPGGTVTTLAGNPGVGGERRRYRQCRAIQLRPFTPRPSGRERWV